MYYLAEETLDIGWRVRTPRWRSWSTSFSLCSCVHSCITNEYEVHAVMLYAVLQTANPLHYKFSRRARIFLSAKTAPGTATHRHGHRHANSPQSLPSGSQSVACYFDRIYMIEPTGALCFFHHVRSCQSCQENAARISASWRHALRFFLRVTLEESPRYSQV